MDPALLNFNKDQSVNESKNNAKALSHRRQRTQTYNIYIYKVLKQLHPKIGLSSKAMKCMDCFCKDMFRRFAEEASHLTDYTNKSSLTAREISTATQLALSVVKIN